MSGFPQVGGIGVASGTEVTNTRTLAQGGPYRAIVIDSFSDQQTAKGANFPQLPYFYGAGVAISEGSPGPTDLGGSTNYAFQFAASKVIWVEAPSNLDDGAIFLNANGDGTAHQFPWVLGRSSTALSFNTLAASGAALVVTNDAGSALAGWWGSGTTAPATFRFFGIALTTTENNFGLRAIAAQTGLLASFQNSTPTTVSAVGPDGGIIPGNNSTAVTASSAALYMGTGAPSNTLGANGSYYFRVDGGVNTHFYFKSAGAWAAMTAF